MLGSSIRAIPPNFTSGGVAIPDDVALPFGDGSTVSILYETADADANALIFVAPEGGATDVPAFIFGDASILNANLGWFNGLTEPSLVVVNDAKDAYVRIDAGDDAVAGSKGIYFKAAADEDIELLNLSVTGTPRIFWDESEDRWSSSHGIIFTAATTIGTSTGNITIAPVSGSNLNFNIANGDTYLWSGATGTGKNFWMLGSTATDGVSNDSPGIQLVAYYDSDAGAGVTSTAWQGTILHDMITAGTTPKSQLKFSINSLLPFYLENNNATTSVSMPVSTGGAVNIGTSCNIKRFYSEITLDTGDAETAVGLTPAAVILSAAIRVSVQIADLDSADHHVKLGVSGNTAKYCDASQGAAATTIDVNKKAKYTFDPTTDTEAAALILTIDGGADNTPSAGKVYVEVIYLDSTNLADV